MAKGVIDADGILNRARPWVHQQAHEIQPFGHLVKLPIPELLATTPGAKSSTPCIARRRS